jgi:predicted ATP-grasp superfamily ATP-dependent carboligase
MNYLENMKPPIAGVSKLIIAFRGWPDAGESATTAIKYILRKLDSEKILDIDPEEFFDFSQQRPTVKTTTTGERVISWPQNEVFISNIATTGENVLTFLGTEPNLKWKAFAAIVIDLCQKWNITNVTQIGSLMDAVPHTRDTRISGSSTEANIQKILSSARINKSTYQGPTGITTAISTALTKNGVHYTSIWGHTPHYLQAAPNQQITYHIVNFMNTLLNLHLDVTDLQEAEEYFKSEVEEAISNDSQLAEYVRKLENSYDEISMDQTLPDPKDLLSELEEYLKNRPTQ